MSTLVLTHEPAQRAPAPARWPSAFSGRLLAAQAQALFASDLSARREYTRTEVAAAIRQAISAHHGLGGCAGHVAAAYGDHPETAVDRMRWARGVVQALRVRLHDHGHVPARFGGLPVLVTAEMAAEIRASRQKQP